MTGYRTLIVAAVTMILGAVQSIEGMIPAEYAGLALQVVGGLTILLRFLTTGPVPLKGKPSTTVNIMSAGLRSPSDVWKVTGSYPAQPNAETAPPPSTTPWTVTHPTGPIPSGTVTTTTSTAESGYINPSNV